MKTKNELIEMIKDFDTHEIFELNNRFCDYANYFC